MAGVFNLILRLCQCSLARSVSRSSLVVFMDLGSGNVVGLQVTGISEDIIKIQKEIKTSKRQRTHSKEVSKCGASALLL